MKLLGNVALIGRPNVGKSTLFNKLVGSRKSIVSNKRGVTRDFLAERMTIKDTDKACLLFDTGGYETDEINFQPFSKNLVWQQTEHAIEKSDLVVFMLDAKEGLQPFDEDILNYLIKKEKKILCVINKVDGKEKETLTWDFYSLRIDSFISVSAAHSRGLLNLKEKIFEELESLQVKKKTNCKYYEGVKKLALIGRPNAGKSSILNRLLGEERALVSPLAGTTRDRIDGYFTYNQKDYQIIDTAGIRRRTKVKEHLEKASVIKSIESIEEADLVVFVFDATEEITDQDIRLINLAVNRYKPTLLIVNKWDLIENKETNTLKFYKRRLEELILKDRSYLPIHFVSCKLNLRIHKIMPLVEEFLEQTAKRAKTSEVNELIQRLVHKHSPRIIKSLSKRTKFYYATQIKNCPPTFVIKCNVAKELQTSYKKYILRSFKEELGFADVPIKIIYEGKEKKEKDPTLEEED